MDCRHRLGTAFRGDSGFPPSVSRSVCFVAFGNDRDQASERTIVSLPLPEATTMNPSER